MADIYFEVADILSNYEYTFPQTKLKKGDVLIFKVGYDHQLFRHDDELGLVYVFSMSRYSGSPGPNGYFGISKTSEDPIAIPAFHTGDTTANNLSTYWIKSSGEMLVVGDSPFEIINCPLQQIPPDQAIGQYINPLPDPYAELWHYDGVSWVKNYITRMYDQVVEVKINGVWYKYIYRWRGAEVKRRVSDSKIWTKI